MTIKELIGIKDQRGQQVSDSAENVLRSLGSILKRFWNDNMKRKW